MNLHTQCSKGLLKGSHLSYIYKKKNLHLRKERGFRIHQKDLAENLTVYKYSHSHGCCSWPLWPLCPTVSHRPIPC